MKYLKIGQGRILKCWESKIKQLYDGEVKDDQLICKNCGNVIGTIKANYLDMNQMAFTYSGRKLRK